MNEEYVTLVAGQSEARIPSRDAVAWESSIYTTIPFRLVMTRADCLHRRIPHPWTSTSSTKTSMPRCAKPVTRKVCSSRRTSTGWPALVK
jgi:hypothetical protein